MPIIDLHCDTIDKLYIDQASLLQNDYHIDLYKLKKGNYLAQWFALFVDIQIAKEPLMQFIRNRYDYLIDQLQQNNTAIELATTFEDYKRIKSSGKIAAFLSLEEGQVIGANIDYLQMMCSLGIRMMTLTWNYENDLGFPHSTAKGLTSIGKQIVSYLNETPILIDISHLSEKALEDIKQLYKKPIIASHCNARSIYNHSRNLSDDVIKSIAHSGGLIGLNLYSLFVDGTSKSTTQKLKEHIRHIYQIGGAEILALGTDFDGMSCELEVYNAGEMGRLINVLEKEYSQSFIDKLTYKNAERIIKENL